MTKQNKVAVVLSGCGFQDGSEIHESVCTLLALDQQGAEYACFAPDIEQTKVQDHYKKVETDEKRNVLVESARIARGDIKPLTQFDAHQFDAIVFPGGFGAAMNLSSFGAEGADCHINADVVKAIASMHQSNKPIGALCIAPVLLARTISNARLTVGHDPDVAQALSQMSATHVAADFDGVVVDTENKLVSTPCYMLDSSIAQIYVGANKLVAELLKLI